MKISTIAAAALLAGVATSASVATAQTAAPQPLVAAGPTIPGLCVWRADETYLTSQVGKFVETRMGQLAAPLQVKLNGEQDSFNAEDKAFNDQRASLTADQVEQRGRTLQQHYTALQTEAQQIKAELEQTHKNAVRRVQLALNPLLQQVMRERSCSILIEGSNVPAVASSMDITPLVVQRLDASLQSFEFELEHLDAQAGPPAQ
jgi:outer membrane protein